jgi:hypothetical protein
VLEAETAREQRRPETSASTSETTPVKVKKTESLGLYSQRHTTRTLQALRHKPAGVRRFNAAFGNAQGNPYPYMRLFQLPA